MESGHVMGLVSGQQMGVYVPHYIFMTLVNLLNEPGGARSAFIDSSIDSAAKIIQPPPCLSLCLS